MQVDFNSMNETDVRESVVRPFIESLGYAHGTQANIRAEVSLQYSRAFLGHKDKTKDPPLRGRADYVCDAVPFGRWTVEVKAPNHELNEDDVQQAHTYAAHPEVGALNFLLTNGRVFRLYVTGNLREPVAEWRHDEMPERLAAIKNILSYEAIRRRVQVLTPDLGKPLGLGLPSRVSILSGFVTYGEHRSDHPLFQHDPLNGNAIPVIGGEVARQEDGLIVADVVSRSGDSWMAELNRRLGLDRNRFFTAGEFISGSGDEPSIFTNFIKTSLPVGTRMKVPGIGEIPMPIGFDVSVYSRAVGYYDGHRFAGNLEFDFEYLLIRPPALRMNPIFAPLLAGPDVALVRGVAEFSVAFE